MKATLSISTTVLKRHQRAGKYTMSILAACGGLKTIRNNLTIRSPKQASMACWNSSANATSSLRQASVHDNAYNRPGVNTIECAPLAHFDSAALAVLLAWRRAARARGMTLRLLNVPAQLANLARAYGIDTLIADRKNASF